MTIRKRVAGRTVEDLRALLQESAASPDRASSVALSLSDGKTVEVTYPAQTLEVVRLADGVTLVVNAERGGHVRAMVTSWQVAARSSPNLAPCRRTTDSYEA